jgi:hypothetical protein
MNGLLNLSSNHLFAHNVKLKKIEKRKKKRKGKWPSSPPWPNSAGPAAPLPSLLSPPPARPTASRPNSQHAAPAPIPSRGPALRQPSFPARGLLRQRAPAAQHACRAAPAQPAPRPISRASAPTAQPSCRAPGGPAVASCAHAPSAHDRAWGGSTPAAATTPWGPRARTQMPLFVFPEPPAAQIFLARRTNFSPECPVFSPTTSSRPRRAPDHRRRCAAPPRAEQLRGQSPLAAQPPSSTSDLAAPCPHRHRRGEVAPSSLPFPFLSLSHHGPSPQPLVAPLRFAGETSLCRCPASRPAGPARGCFPAVVNRSTQQAGAPACRPRAPSPCSFAQPRRRSSSVPSPVSLVPARRGPVAARSARPAALTFSAVAAVRRRTSPLRIAAALLRARRCPARPSRSSTFAVPRFYYLARRVLVKSHACNFARDHGYCARRHCCLHSPRAVSRGSRAQPARIN